MKSWKWKPMTHMSLDFLVKRAPTSLLGVHPYMNRPGHTIMFLFVGIDKQLFDELKLIPVVGYKQLFPQQNMSRNFPIQFSPSDDPFAYIYYHPDDSKFSEEDIINNVCEFRRVDIDGNNPHWAIMRVRTDRQMELERGNYFGNGFYVAEYTWQNYQNPLRFEDLIISGTEYMDNGYFQEEKASRWLPITSFNSFVKGKLISSFNGSNWLVDMAGGHGQDMFRVSGAHIKNALYLDSDAHALSELITRKHDFQRRIKKLNTRIFTKRVDLTEDSGKTLQVIKDIGVPVGSIDIVMCNLAIHYIIGTPANVRNVIHLVNALLKPGGYFFFTAFNGEKIYNMLKDRDVWEIREGGVLKYSIEKKYKSNAIESTGQQIGVLLPFSAGKHYVEFLVNFKYISNEFHKNGFVSIKEDDFGALLPEFRKTSERMYDRITENDMEYINLHKYKIFRKKGGTEPIKTLSLLQTSEANTSSASLIEELANDYPNKKRFKELFTKRTGVIETIEDIPYTLKYEHSNIIKGSTHNGQRKLLLTEIQFMAKTPGVDICIYAGASPGNKTHFLSSLFPDTKLVLIDPNRFDIVVEDRSHRDFKHPDIVHLYHHWPTKSNTYKDNKKMSDLTEGEREDMLNYIIKSKHKLYVIENFMNNDIAQWLTGLRKSGLEISFISDIRSNVHNTQSVSDYDIMWNTAMVFNWITMLSPVCSMIKTRMPYGMDKNKTILHPEDFKQAKEFGIDFESDYMNRRFTMCKGKLYIQAWAPQPSGELRLHVDRENLGEFVSYDIQEIEDKMMYFNSINRSWVWHPNENANKELGFCHCNDCALENKILSMLDVDVVASVRQIGKITGRSLIDTHPMQLWSENIINDTREFGKMVSVAKKQFKYATKRRKDNAEKSKFQRGTAGI
jgi:SAM-dependent methyltransferase